MINIIKYVIIFDTSTYDTYAATSAGNDSLASTNGAMIEEIRKTSREFHSVSLPSPQLPPRHLA